MNEQEYTAFLQGALEADDVIQKGLRLHNLIIPAISDLAQADPLGREKVIGIARRIDELVASVTIQHMEATLKDTKKARQVIEFMRRTISPRIANL